jgi:hypothetical protein
MHTGEHLMPQDEFDFGVSSNPQDRLAEAAANFFAAFEISDVDIPAHGSCPSAV